MRLAAGTLAVITLLASALFAWFSVAMLGTDYTSDVRWIQFLNVTVTWPEAPILAVAFFALTAGLAWVAVSGRATRRGT